MSTSPFLGALTVRSVLYASLLRVFPPSLFLFVLGVPPFFVTMYDVIAESVDSSLAVCVDGVTRLEYRRFDKLLDSLYICTFISYLTYSWMRSTAQRRAAHWSFVPAVVALAVYRLVGIALVLSTDIELFNVLFPNVWLPYVVLFSFCQYTHLYERLKQATCLWWTLVVLTAVYKLVEEVLHYTALNNDIACFCSGDNATSTHSDILAMWVGKLVPIVSMFVAIAIRQ